MTDPAGNNKADLGDLTYDANLTHRLTIQISGNAPGTGTNTPNGVQTTAGVPLRAPVDVIYDFIPATGKPVPRPMRAARSPPTRLAMPATARWAASRATVRKAPTCRSTAAPQ